MMTGGVGGRRIEVAGEREGDGRISVVGVSGEESFTVAGVEVESKKGEEEGGLGKVKGGDEVGEKGGSGEDVEGGGIGADGWTSGTGEEEEGPEVKPKVEEEEPPSPKCCKSC